MRVDLKSSNVSLGTAAPEAPVEEPLTLPTIPKEEPTITPNPSPFEVPDWAEPGEEPAPKA